MSLRTIGGIAALSLLCSALPAQCIRVDALSCTDRFDTIELSWAYDGPGPYTGATIERDGAVVGVVAFPTSTFTDDPPPGSYDYEVTPTCALPPPAANFMACAVTLPRRKHVILDRDDGGLIDSEDALRIALETLCSSVYTINDISELAGTSFLSEHVLWSLAGTFPDNLALDTTTGTFLRDHVLNGGAVYHEGPDTWGFDPLTDFAQVDGVASGIVDGDDSFTSMVGSNFAGAELAGFSGPYTQDQGGNDWTDRLVATNLDIAGSSAGVIWSEGGSLYDTGIFYDTNPTFGKVISVSWEFGGAPQVQQIPIALAYIDALEELHDFRRGDVNADGLLNIADAIFLLSFLFPSGPPVVIPCGDAADANDEGLMNIADAIYLLSGLFGGGPPPPAPFPGCGQDPTVDLLVCDIFDPCP